MKKQILSKFKSYQKNWLENAKTNSSLSQRIEHAAQDKRIGLSPQVKLLIQAIGETVESDIYDTDNEATVLQLTDIVESDNNEVFHDTEDKSPYSSSDEWKQRYVRGPDKGELWYGIRTTDRRPLR